MVLDSTEALRMLPHLVWPLALALAWALGEAGRRHFRLPRVAAYAFVGFLLAPTQLGWLPLTTAPGGVMLPFLATAGGGLLMLEFGYRINLRWYRHNPWLLVSAALEALLTLAALVTACRLSGLDDRTAWLVGALGMASSPLALMRVLHDEQSAGQISERLLHVGAFSCVLAVLVFNVTVGTAVAEETGWWAALGQGVWRLGLSAVLGTALGAALPMWLRWQRLGARGPVPLVLAALLLVGLAQAWQLSAIVAALAFGLAARHYGLVLARDAHGLGLLGELTALLLFVYIGSRLDFQLALQGIELGLLLVVLRLGVKAGVLALLARPSGITLRKGALTGLGLMPLSAFAVLLLLDQSLPLALAGFEQLAPLVAALCVLELLGPWCTMWALHWGRELPEPV